MLRRDRHLSALRLLEASSHPLSLGYPEVVDKELPVAAYIGRGFLVHNGTPSGLPGTVGPFNHALPCRTRLTNRTPVVPPSVCDTGRSAAIPIRPSPSSCTRRGIRSCLRDTLSSSFGQAPGLRPMHTRLFICVLGTLEEKISTLFTHPPATLISLRPMSSKMCNPCPRTTVTHLSGLYTPPEGGSPLWTPPIDRDRLRAGAGASPPCTPDYSSALAGC